MNPKEYVEKYAVLNSDEHAVVKTLWDGRCRVNVWKYDPNRIVKSYFIRTENDEVVSCNPSIVA